MDNNYKEYNNQDGKKNKRAKKERDCCCDWECCDCDCCCQLNCDMCSCCECDCCDCSYY